MSAKEKPRLDWVDQVKLAACALVALGHLMQSFRQTGMIESGSRTYDCFMETIYLFHVPVFFFCSGYLQQVATRISGWGDWRGHAWKKLLNIGVPYLVFSMATWLMKAVFSGAVATPIRTGFLDTLLLHPTSPYWFLYVLLPLALFYLPFRTRGQAAAVVAFAVALKISSLFWWSGLFMVDRAMDQGIWFVLGILVAYSGRTDLFRKSAPWALLFLPLAFAGWWAGLDRTAASIPLTFLGIVMTVTSIHRWGPALPARVSALLKAAAPWTLHIFLMHTLCASPVRNLLFHLGVRSLLVHVPLGLAASFLLPVVVGRLAAASPVTNFVFQPGAILRRNRPVPGHGG